jgi:hypothetical protein
MESITKIDRIRNENCKADSVIRRNSYIIENRVALRLQLKNSEVLYRRALAKLRHQTNSNLHILQEHL